MKSTEVSIFIRDVMDKLSENFNGNQLTIIHHTLLEEVSKKFITLSQEYLFHRYSESSSQIDMQAIAKDKFRMFMADKIIDYCSKEVIRTPFESGVRYSITFMKAI